MNHEHSPYYYSLLILVSFVSAEPDFFATLWNFLLLALSSITSIVIFAIVHNNYWQICVVL